MSQRKPSRRKHAEQLELIGTISQELVQTENTEPILEKALLNLHTLLGYRAAQIYRISPYGQDIWLYLSEGGSDWSITKLAGDI